MLKVNDLPAINAFLNSCSTVSLLMGYYWIKNQDVKKHKVCMISAFSFSTLFLILYLIYHYHVGSKLFPDLGWIKTIYLIILFTHVVLAIVMLPMIFATFYYALKDIRALHKKWARWTFPIWLYVSFTGVIIYMMLYQWFAQR